MDFWHPGHPWSCESSGEGKIRALSDTVPGGHSTRSLKISGCNRWCPKDLRVRAPAAPMLTHSLIDNVQVSLCVIIQDYNEHEIVVLDVVDLEVLEIEDQGLNDWIFLLFFLEKPKNPSRIVQPGVKMIWTINRQWITEDEKLTKLCWEDFKAIG